MEDIIRALEDILKNDMERHDELICCLELERQALVEANVDVIMKMACRKQALAQAIMESIPHVDVLWQKVFPGKKTKVSIRHIDKVVSGGDPGIFRTIRQSLVELNHLKDKVRELTSANRAIAEDCLMFVRDLFSSIMVGDSADPPTYGRSGQVYRRADSNLLMHQEV
ncbi:Putative FlgN family protein [Desulfatibacillum aliphaticivorans]|uniref:FlgN family protein n=1 Tax=Desulfatibacillum aliphaticivorans TaxID=218208 RepID=B8FK16_DESAL|nr:flagellar export chaperone FlgN [Desulfatibacillum aliphaticivorans]ACL02691.1 Putative FlgN family protein [Desulfatibacillum aliphaticivorans]